MKTPKRINSTKIVQIFAKYFANLNWQEQDEILYKLNKIRGV